MKSLLNGSSAALNFYTELPQLLSSKKNLALATVAATKGSAPQKTGISAVFGENRLIAGTIGGGIVEFSIQKVINDIVQAKQSQIRAFNLTNKISDKEGAICGGSMEILLDAEPEKYAAVFKAISESLGKREPGVMLIVAKTDSGGRLHIEREWITTGSLKNKTLSLSPVVDNHLQEMLNRPTEGDFRRTDIEETAEEEKQSVFLETIVPAPRLIIAGAGHVGKALSHLGKFLGFEVVVWDYRSEYATKENVPDADVLLSGNIEETLAGVATDRNTYIVAVTTGHKQDIEVLKLFIGSPAGYIGMIGSRKKTILIREQFLAEGWATEEQWARIHAPVGLDIHSETVEEIALSIAAQLVQVRHQINKKQ